MTRRWCLPFVLFGLAAGPAAARVDEGFARHLLERSGFTPTADELAEAQAAANYPALVETIIDRARRAPDAPVAWPTFDTRRDVRPGQLNDVERQAFRRATRQDMGRIRMFWVESMRTTTTPLKERMTLFWHNHFVSSAQKVRSPHAMMQQHRTFRKHALGNFGALLKDMVRDPALLFYLDNQRNHRRAPNENLARELFELFTLGEGHYTERDIKEAARALTGSSIDRDTKTFRFRRRQHDTKEKTILGRTGRFGADALVALILEQPRTAEYVVEKLWREFVSPSPDARAVREIAATFRRSNHEISAALRALFLHPTFVVEAGRGSLIKSPVDVVIGTERLVPRGLDARQAVRALAQMGQNLLAPPNVKGWPGHTTWVTTASIDRRRVFLRQAWKDRLMAVPRETVGPHQLLATPPAGPLDKTAAPEKQLHQALLDPAYQVK